MNDSRYWSEACSAALHQPLATQLNSITASVYTSISVFVAAAIASLIVFVPWALAHRDARKKLWRLLGAFAGLAFVGLCCGCAKFYAMGEFESSLVHSYVAGVPDDIK